MFNRKEYMRKYQQKYRKNLKYYSEYHGVVICSKCGKEGYKHYQGKINIKTGAFYKMFTEILHRKMISKKLVYQKCCYLGMGKL